jgi:hypothetical protein
MRCVRPLLTTLHVRVSNPSYGECLVEGVRGARVAQAH